ncbi:hypothetical protein MUK42_35139 [Musa troglodytarum]|uniref:Uncharacterized protein n=1 Tax=Musa troglodytarum TaxID=320322 RepID=A0A9E7EAP4_9LILI|nr:hypothetical protein MUK42_35139 [Musa troglodytarum]
MNLKQLGMYKSNPSLSSHFKSGNARFFPQLRRSSARPESSPRSPLLPHRGRTIWPCPWKSARPIDRPLSLCPAPSDSSFHRGRPLSLSPRAERLLLPHRGRPCPRASHLCLGSFLTRASHLSPTRASFFLTEDAPSSVPAAHGAPSIAPFFFTGEARPLPPAPAPAPPPRAPPDHHDPSAASSPAKVFPHHSDVSILHVFPPTSAA